METKAKILLIEDSKTQLIYLQSILEDNSYKVVATENGKEALTKIEEFFPDIIISDILMPEMDGYEFCKIIKENDKWKGIPVILLTALADPQDVIKGLKVGADNFISKPFASDFLLSRIENLLINKKMRENSVQESDTEVYFGGTKHLITSDRMQIVDLLLSTYENAVSKNNELLKTNLELIMLKEDLEKKNVQLEKTNEEKNRFIGIAAHDIRNPLGAITNFTELLEDDLGVDSTDYQKKLIELVKSSASSLMELVNELLDISKIEAGKLVLKRGEHDIVGIIKNNIAKNKYLSDKKNIRIIENYEIDQLLLHIDKSRIDQVLDNLISNAIKYTESGGEIGVILCFEDNNLKCSVQDNGVGIPKEELELLFKPFSKTSAQATAGESSTGLGLFTCHKIVNAHNGSISATSVKGYGSTFSFTIPMPNPEAKVIKVVSDEMSISNLEILKGKRILIVDDMDINYFYFTSAFGNIPVQIEWIKSGAAAIEKIRETQYDVILMDVYLPDMSGLDVTKEIREFNKDVVIVCQSANSVAGMNEKCLEAGCNDYISLPIQPNEVIKGVVRNLSAV